MTAPSTSTCSPWATEADLCSPCDDYTALQTDASEFLQAASDLLFDLTQRKYPGVCSVVVRPCARRTWGPPTVMDPSPLAMHVGGVGWQGLWPGAFLSAGGWGSCGCRDQCGCARLHQIELGAHPIVDVARVTVDGIDLVPDVQYRVDDWHWLVRLNEPDGTNPGWPVCQDRNAASTEVGTWEVEFSWGRMPPRSGVNACASLACELAMACQPEDGDRCRLPKRVQSLARQGVQMVMTDLLAMLDQNRTGIPEVDLFIKAENPRGLRRPSSVWTPGMTRPVRRVGT